MASSIDPNIAAGSNPFSETTGECWKAVKDGTADDKTVVAIRTEPGISIASYCHQWFYLDSSTSMADQNTFKMLQRFGPDGSTVVCEIELIFDDPSYKIRGRFYDGGSYDTSDWSTITTNTEYRLEYLYNATQGIFKVDGASIGSAATITSSLTQEGLETGIIDVDADDDVIIYLDDVQIKTDGWIGATIVSVTDAGAGADAIDQLLVALTLSDTAAGADASPAPLASLALAETSAGADVIASLLASVPVTDTGAGDDQVAPAVTLTLTDSGSAADVVSKLVLAVVTDSGAGADGSPAVTVAPITVADTGAGVTNITIAASVPVTDAAAGADIVQALSEFFKTVTDTGHGFETDPWGTTGIDEGTGGIAAGAGGIAAGFIDSGQVIRVAVDLSLADTGAGADASPAVTVTLTLSDIASGVDGSPAITVTLTLADTGSAIDAAGASGATLKIVTEAGLGSDDIATISVTIPVTDAGAGADGMTIAAAMAVLETAQAVEAVIKSALGDAAVVTFTAKDKTLTITGKSVTRTFVAKTGGNS